MEKVDLLEGMANYKKLEGEEKVKFEEALLLAELQFEPLHMELKRRIEEKYAEYKKMKEDKVEYDDLDDFCSMFEILKRMTNRKGFTMLFSDRTNIKAGLTNRMRRLMYNQLGYPVEGIRFLIHDFREEEFNLRSLEMHNPSKLIEAYDKLFEDKEKDLEDSEAD